MKFPIELNDNEKKFHVIWIGKLPLHELDNLKIWAKWNPDFIINIWIDSNHTLVPLLKQLIIKNTSDCINGEAKNNPLTVASLQSYFYKQYSAIKSKISFNAFVKEFIINQCWKTENEIDQWIKAANAALKNEKINIENDINNKVLVRDVALENSDIFDNEKYYYIYLRELEEAHFVVGASDLLRYQILMAEGGIYLDTDVLPLLDFDKIMLNSDNENIFISFLNANVNIDLVINELMKLIIFERVDNNSLQLLKTRIDSSGVVSPNIEVWSQLLVTIKNFTWENYVKTPLVVTNGEDCLILKCLNQYSNAFIISNKKSMLLQTVQTAILENYQEIWKSKTGIINNLVQKLINKFYVINTTGAGLFLEKANVGCLATDLCSLECLNNVSSWWINNKLEIGISWEDLKAKYTLQRLVCEDTPNIKMLQRYKQWNDDKLLQLKLQWDSIAKKINNLNQQLTMENSKPEDERITFGFEESIVRENKFQNNINNEILEVATIQNMILKKMIL